MCKLRSKVSIHKSLGLLIAVSVFAFTSPCAYAQDAVTLDQVLRHVYTENPTLQASRFGQKVTHELYPQAKAGWHPTINAEAGMSSSFIDTDPTTTADGTTTKSVSIIAEQPLYRGGRTQAEILSANSRINAGYYRMLQTEQQVFLRTTEVYMDVIRNRMLLHLQDTNRETLAKQKDSLQARFDAGDVTSTDLKRAEARLAQAEALRVEAVGALQESEALFEQIIGYAPPPIITMPEPSFAIPSTLVGMLDVAQANNPQWFFTRYDHMAAESDIDIARSDQLPTVSAFASHITEYDPQPGVFDETSTSTIGLRARINLYEGGRTVSRIREAKNRENQRYIQIREAERQMKSALVESWSRLQSTRAAINAREMEVASAQLSAEGLREEARLGERTTIETLDAERDLLESQVALANAKRDNVVSAYELAAALGLLLPEKMGMADIAYDPGPHYRAVSDRIFSSEED